MRPNPTSHKSRLTSTSTIRLWSSLCPDGAADKTLILSSPSAGSARPTHQRAEPEHDWHVGLRLCRVQLWVAGGRDSIGRSAETRGGGQMFRSGSLECALSGRPRGKGRLL
jgi:hypothetical protein